VAAGIVLASWADRGGTVYDAGDPSSIEGHARLLVNRRVGELVDVLASEQQGTYTKGSVGRYVETFFGIEANSEAGPDLPEAGIELKSVPLQGSGRGPYTAKERTFITAIDYSTVVDQSFDGSPLDLKSRYTLYVFYEWRRDVPIAAFKVLGVLLHERDELDELMLRELHAHVQQAVRRGRAHEISEGDTWGVGAATKDAGGKWVAQPFSPERARRRAFAYKPAYTTRLWQLAKHQAAQGAASLDMPDSLAAFEAEVAALVRPWHGVSVAALKDRFAPDKDPLAKNIVSVLSRRILGSEGHRDVEAFARLGITIRTARVHPESLLPHEDVSFPVFRPEELVRQEWESSELLQTVSSLYFMVFTMPPAAPVLGARLLGGFFWRPSTDQLATMGREWKALRGAFAASRPEDRPQGSETEILHVRPHARNKDDILPLPSGRPYVKSSFWLNREFVGALVNKHLGGHAERS
jgi:DNA mismatch repair protein MutH